MIPPELITEIFTYIPTTLSLHCPSCFPWYLGQICSTSRAVFHSTPQFWSDISIDMPMMLRRKSQVNMYERAIALLRLFLDRNQGQRFCFSFVMPRHLGNIQQYALPYAHEILNILVDNSTHWQDVFLDIDLSESPMLTRARGRLPSLASLRLLADDGLASDEMKHMFSEAPQLRHIQFWHFPAWQFDWSLLASIQFQTMPRHRIDELLHILSQATGLERFRYEEANQVSDTVHLPQVNIQIRMQKLKVLYLPNPDILPYLNTPALRELHIHNNDAACDAFSEIVASFLLRSDCSLDKLTLGTCQAVDAIEILKHTPDIYELTLAFISASPYILEYLKLSRGHIQHILARRIRSLDLQLAHPQEADFDRIATVVVSRATMMGAVERLERLSMSLKFTHNYEKAAINSQIERLSQLCFQHGVKFAIEQ
ncbi:hypothetical protein AMATHDRAFT_62251 [Amanita thiersii Skay4041]|uniref:F-box domain-containing protein n=1 Tax=Amanita thiersii Skay4041 TaxID=703135 RepID=A0A2A9NNM0_9AGAR|nr:hypothetical protein AMATHDRAFT_62251 [Amanita thiersii Skay4041]